MGFSRQEYWSGDAIAFSAMEYYSAIKRNITAQNAGPTESVPLRTTRVPEPERLRPGRCMQPREGSGRFLGEQPRD